MKRLVIAVAVTALALTGAIPAEAVSQHPKPSQKFGRMIIPKIGLNTPIFEGGKDLFTAAYPASLNRGPAHYRGEPFPWEPGVSMFAGHRTTWSHPFRRLDEMRRGDRIILRLPGHGTLRYRVVRRPEFPYGPAVDRWNAKRGLMLTACHPPGSDRQRVVVKAKLL
jgi:sortase A